LDNKKAKQKKALRNQKNFKFMHSFAQSISVTEFSAGILTILSLIKTSIATNFLQVYVG
jgi:hypothetical protein